MMYIHYCTHCDRIHMLSGHKTACPACSESLVELPISFLEYEEMSMEERCRYQERCRRQA